MDFGMLRAKMEHNAATRYMAVMLRKIGLVHFLHTIQAMRKRKELNGRDNEFSLFFKEHISEFKAVYDILEDDFSRETYKSVLHFRKTYDINVINSVNIQPQYFLKEILPPQEKEVFVDGGAYIGDTAKEFLKIYQEGHDYKIYLWEPDKENKVQISKILGMDVKYEIIPYAMWNERKKLRFSNEGTGTSTVGDKGVIIEADCIDNQHKDEKITFLKMDIEGAEIQALKGAEKTIKRCKPKLAICIYHKFEHLYQIPLMIKEMVPEYKLYIRHHSDTESETVVYAICRQE